VGSDRLVYGVMTGYISGSDRLVYGVITGYISGSDRFGIRGNNRLYKWV
jgi:hypothetical protein